MSGDNQKVALELGLQEEEYRKILAILNRVPTPTEIAMFSVEWSEHCGYPHSRKWFELFPREGNFTALVGEDAGGIVYQGTAIVFKMESHNHPSQVEPRQGAATGIGGIIRDILGSGARPIACLDSLHFGSLDDQRSRYLLKGVVDGIAFYGNCVGVPTVAGELYFHPSFQGNCLVNVMCLGIAPQGALAAARAQGEGNLILYVGNKTGRDGIGGCSVLASQEFREGEEKRPSVQIGDPFTEKCLIEATLEVLETGYVLGIKDMGAAGLTCSSSEMAASGKCGVEIDLDRVPVREENMEAWEIMMSESQERMLLCVDREHEQQVIAIFHKWGLEAVTVGQVITQDKVVVKHRGEIVAQVPAQALTQPPVYNPPQVKPDYLDGVNDARWKEIVPPSNWEEVLTKMVSSPNLFSRRWVYEQYDHMVQTNTVVLPGSGTVILRVKGEKWGIGVTSDCNPVYCYLDPYRGAQMTVAEAARNLASAGARPAGITDCLNFGNPQKPDRYWQFVQAVRGLSEAARFFGLPVVSGNVSFYNENPRGAVYPTPTIGMVGIIEDVSQAVSSSFAQEGNWVILLGDTKEELGGSEYLRLIFGMEVGPPPELNLKAEKQLQDLLLDLIAQGLLLSSVDLSEGGLALALVESCVTGEQPMGVRVELESLGPIREDALLFGESCSRALISVSPTNLSQVQLICQKYGVPNRILGKTGGDKLVIGENGRTLISVKVDEIAQLWTDALGSLL